MRSPRIPVRFTQAFESKRYNFTGQVLSGFAQACSEHGIRLLLTHPVELEMRRHLRESATGAFSNLESQASAALAKVPFLSGWPHLPDLSGLKRAARIASFAATREFDKYLSRLKVVRHGYEGVDLHEIMHLYDGKQPPFGDGKKRKEFPDALTLAIARAYAQKQQQQVAVISGDNDIRTACKSHMNLTHFASIERFMESLVNDSTDVAAIKIAVEGSAEFVDAVIAKIDWGEVAGVVEEAGYIQGTDFGARKITDVDVLAVGDDYCSVAFHGNADLSLDLVIPADVDVGPDEDLTYEALYRIHFTGVAKVSLSDDRASVTEVTGADVKVIGAGTIDASS